MRRTIEFHALAWAAALACLCGTAQAQGRDAEAADLSLEELLRSEVVTVSRKPQSLQSTAAAAFVITREDIERSGAISVPEALRLAPGVQVARLANSRWAVSVRGSNNRFANKLQVLIDGRSIYSPLFSGVLWEDEDTLLEDIERIEVIRGPGAALWGANAVNGVINIITRKARDTQGGLLVASTGSEERGGIALRQGFATADGHLRVWGKAFSRRESVTLDGQPGNDRWGAVRAGFRGDWALAGGRRLTLSGGAYRSDSPDRWEKPDVTSASGFTLTDIDQVGRGLHLLGRHEWALDGGAEAALQVSFDHSDLNLVNTFRQRRNTLDVDFQHRPRGLDGHDVVWGLGVRFSPDRAQSLGFVRLTPDARDFRLFSAYVHDEIDLPQRLRLTLGMRLEHNSLTGVEPQPNARLIWTPSASDALWTSLSRAVRTPSRAELDSIVDLAVTPGSLQRPPLLTRTVGLGLGGLEAERLTAFELGYRHQFGNTFSLDATAFVNQYAGLRSGRMAAPPQVAFTPTGVPYLLMDINPNNGLDARARGLEVAAEWHVMPWWRIQPVVSLLNARATSRTADLITTADAEGFASNSPRTQWSLRSSMNLASRTQFDAWLRRTGSIGGASRSSTGGVIPAYTTLDLRFAWRITPGLELSLVGQNLLESRHQEITPDLLPSQALLIERAVYAKARWQY